MKVHFDRPRVFRSLVSGGVDLSVYSLKPCNNDTANYSVSV